jgi:hypothetical protein
VTKPKIVTLEAAEFWKARATFAERRAATLEAFQMLQRAKADADQALDAFCRAHGFDTMRPLEFDDAALEVRQAVPEEKKGP